jgi:aspartyl aminopeptidase
MSRTIAALIILLIASSSASAQSASSTLELGRDYREFLNDGRTPSRLLRHTLRKSRWKVVDPARDEVVKTRPGDRLVFINQDRTAVFVVVGRESILKSGARLIASHIDTPSPRLALGALTRDNQTRITAKHHGGAKKHHWKSRPLAIVGEVVTKSGERKDVELGLAGDDYAFFIESDGDGYKVITSSTPTKREKGGKDTGHFVGVLHERYGIDAEDLLSAELYVVPRMGARFAGLDYAMVGGHGQDDRVNSFAAWRAISSLKGAPQQTAMAWLLDREEVGSTGRSGAQSKFLELVYGYLLRAQSSSTSDASLWRALGASEAVSADTPACVNPNWPEVHEIKNAPILGRGLALFPMTGHGGKVGGSSAHAEIIGRLRRRMRAVPLQTAELGRVDEGGGGTVAKYLAHRGIDTVDIGVCVVGMHSPHELASLQDIKWAIQGFAAWYTAP